MFSKKNVFLIIGVVGFSFLIGGCFSKKHLSEKKLAAGRSYHSMIGYVGNINQFVSELREEKVNKTVAKAFQEEGINLRDPKIKKRQVFIFIGSYNEVDTSEAINLYTSIFEENNLPMTLVDLGYCADKVVHCFSEQIAGSLKRNDIVLSIVSIPFGYTTTLPNLLSAMDYDFTVFSNELGLNPNRFAKSEKIKYQQ